MLETGKNQDAKLYSDRSGTVHKEQIPEYYVGDMSVTIHSKHYEKYLVEELEIIIKNWFENNYNRS